MNIHFTGLQQCVSNKNGTAISNPVLHRDCRNISGSTASNGDYFFYFFLCKLVWKKKTLPQFSQMVVKVVQPHLQDRPDQIHHNIQLHQHLPDHQHRGQHHPKDLTFPERLPIRRHHNTMGQIKRGHSVLQVIHNKLFT